MNENIFTKLRIPTLLGLAIILLGGAAGVFLVLQKDSAGTKVSAQETPQNIVITNLTSTEATISWKTPVATLGHVSYGKNSDSEKTALDDRDTNTLSPRQLHYVSLKDLSPKTEYHFKVLSGKFTSIDPLNFTTPENISSQNGYQPIIGSVILGNNPYSDGIVYLSSPGMSDQSSLIGKSGSFIIPISTASNDQLSGVFQPQSSQVGTVKIVAENGQFASGSFNILKMGGPVGPFRLGTNISFASSPKPSSQAIPAPSASSNPTPQYDLNLDKKLNASDYSALLNNLGKNPKDKRADLNNDGVVDQKDLRLMEDVIERSPQ